MKTSGPFAALSVCHFVGSLLFWPLGVRARSVGRREQVSGDETQCLSVRCTPLLCVQYQRGTLTNSATVPRFSSLPKRSESGRHEKAARGGQARYLSPAV